METLLYRNWRLFALAVGVVAVLGVSSLLTIGRQEDPTITNLFATIVTPFPGAEPARVEALVTEKIEIELREIPEIETINSTSRTGISVVRIELSSFISKTQIEQTWSEVRDAISDAARNFPPNVPEPEFDDDRTGAYTSISAITPGSSEALAIAQRYAETLRDRLRQIPGTKSVDLFGAGEEEILVSVDPEKLVVARLTVGDVSAAIRQADSKVRAGQVRGRENDLLVEVAGEIDGLDRVRRIPLRLDGFGATLTVGDVAEVARALRSPVESIAYSNGEASILVAARLQNDLQVDTWMKSVSREISAFEETLPRGIAHSQVFDQARYTRDRLTGVGLNMLTGLALVLSVLFVSLGWRAALIVATVLPLTALGALTVLQLIGLTIHQMSVTGMVVALGLLVDAAIVMTEQIRQRIAAGMARLEAVQKSVHRLAVPLLASTATTVLAFVPMAFLPGPAGDFVGSIAIAVIVMLLVSLVLALTITPALAGWLLPAKRDGSSSLGASGITIPALARAFRASIDLSLRNPGLSVLFACILPVIGFVSLPTLTAQFFPGVDRDQFYIQINMPGAAAIGETERLVLAADQLIRDAEGVSHVDWVIGESAPAFYYNMVMDRDGDPGFAEALVTSSGAEATESLISQLQTQMDHAFPEAQSVVRGLVQGPPVDAPVELRVVGSDIATLRAIGDRLRTIMASANGVTHTRTTLVGGAPKVVFELDENAVELAGLDLGEVASQLDLALEGATGGSLIEGVEELPVRVRFQADARDTALDISNIDVLPRTVSAGAGYPGIPLSRLGRIEITPSESPIARRDGERVNTVQAFLVRDILPEEALNEVRASLAGEIEQLPPGYRIEIGGDSDARAETSRNLASTAGLVVTLTIVVIVLTFGSYRLSLITGFVAFLSMGLSVLALAVFNFPFGIQALIGVIGSIGVSVNAAIILLTGMQEDDAARAGDVERMVQVVVDEARHIISTTVTTFGGFLPLILAGGGFWPPFAMAIAGGVLLSTVVSFYFTPAMYRLVMARRDRSRNAGTVPVEANPVS